MASLVAVEAQHCTTGDVVHGIVPMLPDGTAVVACEVSISLRSAGQIRQKLAAVNC